MVMLSRPCMNSHDTTLVITSGAPQTWYVQGNDLSTRYFISRLCVIENVSQPVQVDSYFESINDATAFSHVTGK